MNPYLFQSWPPLPLKSDNKTGTEYEHVCPKCWRSLYPARWPIPYRYPYHAEICVMCGCETESGLLTPAKYHG